MNDIGKYMIMLGGMLILMGTIVYFLGFRNFIEKKIYRNIKKEK